MTITASKTDGGGELAHVTTIRHLDDAGSPAAASYKLGFRPRYVEVMNATDRISFKWYEGMASGYAINTLAAGTATLITTGGVTVVGDTIGFPVLQNKQFHVVAIG